MNDDVSLSSTRTCLFTAANDRSHKCSTGTYRETSIVPTSCTKHTQRGTVQGGHGGEHGDKEDTYCTLSSNTPVLTPPTEKGLRRGGEGEDEKERGERGEGEVGYFDSYSNTKRTCTNRIASRHCAPVFTVIVTGSRTTPWQDHPFEICRYDGSL